MESSNGLSTTSISLYIFIMITQVLAISLLPRTAGFTSLFWTASVILTYTLSLWAISYILHNGMPISAMIPAMSAVVPLATVVVGVVFYKEAASVPRIALLCSACGLIGLANIVG